MLKTVRIRIEDDAKLRELSVDYGIPVREVLAEAIDQLYRKRFLERCDQAYARLKSDPRAGKQELSERAVWEQTLDDGLEDA